MKNPLVITSLYGRGLPNRKRALFSDPGYQAQAEKIHDIWEKVGLRLVRSPLTAWKKGQFSYGWEFRKGTWCMLKPYRPDIVWNRMSFEYTLVSKLKLVMQDTFVIGHPMFVVFASSKFLTAQIFPAISPRTAFVSSERTLARALRLIPGSKVVIKPDTGSGGRGVQVVRKSEAKPEMIQEPSVVQEFIETAKGFGSLVHGRFDLRVEMINEKVFKAYLRMAAPGKYLSNVHQGGTMQWIPEKKIPADVVQHLRSMQSRLASLYPLYYTVDFLIDAKGRSYLGEINYSPGIKFPDGFKGLEEDSWKQLAHFFVSQYNEWKK